MATSPVCVSLRKQISDLQRTLNGLKNKLAEDTKRGDKVQIADDKAGIAIAEDELANLESNMIENGCYEHSPPPPLPPKVTLSLLPSTIHPGEGFRIKWSFSYTPTTTTFGIGDRVFVQLFLGLYSAPDPGLRLRTKLWERTDIEFPPAESALVGRHSEATWPCFD